MRQNRPLFAKSSRSISIPSRITAIHATLRQASEQSSDEVFLPEIVADDSAWKFTKEGKTGLLANVLEKLSRPVMVGVLALALIFGTPLAADAASGGRVGGRNFSSSSRSYSAPRSSGSSRSYGGSSSGGSSAPSLSYRSSTSIIAPSIFVPTYGYGYGGYGVGGYGGGGIGTIFTLMFVGMAAFYFINIFNKGASQDDSYDEYDPRVSVLRLQVGLLGIARGLQDRLDALADKADTSSPEGLHYILSETTLALNRKPEYCVYGYTTGTVVRDVDDAEQRFNEYSLEERGKFEEETLVNVGSRRVGTAPFASFSSNRNAANEFIVVTIVVAAEGNYTLPQISTADDLRRALVVMGSIPADSIQAVEVLWTPQEAGDVLTAQDLLADYPLLRPL